MAYSCANQNIITIGQGSTYSDTITVKDSNNIAVNLSGYSVRSQLRTINGDLAGTFTCALPDPANGLISRSLTSSITASLTPGASGYYVWGIELTSSTGVILSEIQGGVIVIAEVCR